MIVMMIASTPSLNASNLPLCIASVPRQSSAGRRRPAGIVRDAGPTAAAPDFFAPRPDSV